MKNNLMGRILRKRLLLLGGILLLSGIISVSLYNSSLKDYVFKDIYKSSDAWEVSGYFNSGDRLTFGMSGNDAWYIIADAEMRHVGENILGMNLTIEINNTKGGKWVFNLTLIRAKQKQKLIAWNVYLISNTEDFIFNEFTPPASAIVTESGEYSARITQKWLYDLPLPPEGKPAPPKSLILMREVVGFKYPYRNPFILGIGLTLMGFGASVLIISRRKKRRTR